MPDLAILRLSVMDEDMFGDPSLIGQSCIPLPRLSTGYRSIPLYNGSNEPLELASLFLHIDVQVVDGGSNGTTAASVPNDRPASATSRRVSETDEPKQLKRRTSNPKR